MAVLRKKKEEAKQPIQKKEAKTAKPIALKPRMSEKSYALSESLNTYVFDVPGNFNRYDVAAAVGSQYGVTVASVRIAAQPGKTKRTFNRQSRSFQQGKVSPARKAYIRLKEGDKLPIFAGVEDEKPAKETK
jgi:ribosomal protein L23